PSLIVGLGPMRVALGFALGRAADTQSRECVTAVIEGRSSKPGVWDGSWDALRFGGWCYGWAIGADALAQRCCVLGARRCSDFGVARGGFAGRARRRGCMPVERDQRGEAGGYDKQDSKQGTHGRADNVASP